MTRGKVLYFSQTKNSEICDALRLSGYQVEHLNQFNRKPVQYSQSGEYRYNLILVALDDLLLPANATIEDLLVEQRVYWGQTPFVVFTSQRDLDFDQLLEYDILYHLVLSPPYHGLVRFIKLILNHTIPVGDLQRQIEIKSKSLDLFRSSPKQIVDQIIEAAVNLVRARSGGIEHYFEETDSLEVISNYKPAGRASTVGYRIQRNEGIAGKLLQMDEDYLIVPNYSVWENRIEQHASEQNFGSIIALKLVYQGTLVGALYVEDAVGRSFTPSDIKILRDYAHDAAVALSNSQLFAEKDKENDLLDRLLTTSPTAMIANRIDGQIENVELVLKHKDGHGIRVNFSATLLISKIGQHEGYVGYFETISDLLNAEQRSRLMFDISKSIFHAPSQDAGYSNLVNLLIQTRFADSAHIFVRDNFGQEFNLKACSPLSGRAPVGLDIPEKLQDQLVDNNKLDRKIIRTFA